MSESPRRGWRETVEPGLYRLHRVACPATRTHKPGHRCRCSYAAHVPGRRPGDAPLRKLDARTLTDARREKKRLQAQGRPDPQAPDGSITLDDFFWNFYLPGKQLAAKTREQYTWIYQTKIRPRFGHLRLDQIRREQIELWLTVLDKEAQEKRARTGRRNPRYVPARLSPLQSLLTQAVKWKRLKESPADGLELPECPPASLEEEEAEPKRVINIDEVLRTLQACEQLDDGLRIQLLISIGTELCLRNSEIRGLRWPDFDFETMHVQIQRQIDPATGNVKRLKGRQQRRLPFNNGLARNMRRLYKLEVETSGAHPSGYVFLRKDHKRPLARQTPNAWLRRALLAANVVTDEGEPKITPHGLRHTGASILFDQNMPLIKISRFLGHASITVTEQIYAHLLDDTSLDELAACFDAVLTRKRSTRPRHTRKNT